MKKAIFPGWWQVAVSLMNQGVSSGSIIVAFSIIAVSLQKEFDTTRATLGLIMTITYLINGLANPIMGTLMDRWSLRKVLIGGSVSLALGYIALSFATSITQVFLAYGIFLALANATLGPLSYSTLLPRWFVRRRARAVGITALGYSIGGILLPPIFHFLIESFGWRDAMRIFAAVVIVFVIPLISWLVINRPSDVGLYPDGDEAPPPAAENIKQGPAEELPTSKVLRDMNFWVLTLAIGLVVCGAAGVLGNMASLALARGFTGGQGAFAVSCFAVGSFSSKTLYALFGDHLKARVGLAAGLGFFIISSVAFLYATTYPIFLTASFLHGLAVGTALPLWSFLTALVFGPPNVGRVFGLITVMTTPISLVTPPLLGRIYDVTGSYNYGFVIYIFLGFGVMMLVPRLRIAAAVPAPLAAAA